MIELRDYQVEAINAVYDYIRENKEGNPCVVLPTGAGKTIVITKICKDYVSYGARVMVVTHQSELLSQAADKLNRFGLDDYGIYCAKLGNKQTDRQVTLASIQSVYKHAKYFKEYGEISLIIVDEAHRIPAAREGQYSEFIESMKHFNPSVRVIGLTATPYRMGSGTIYGVAADGEHRLFDCVCYEKPVEEMINDGYLSPLLSVAGKFSPDLKSIHIKRGEFDPRESSDLYSDKEFVSQAVSDILSKTKDRKRILLFCCSIEHSEVVCEEIKIQTGLESVYTVHSQKSSDLNDEVLKEFRGTDGDKIYLCNVDILTTGFDAPNIDAVVLLRPTCSTGLYVQMVGRGLRLCDEKNDCLILDYGGNILRHGPINDPIIVGAEEHPEEIFRACDCCGYVQRSILPTCGACGYVFPVKAINDQEEVTTRNRIIRHEVEASELSILGRKEKLELVVTDWKFGIHKKLSTGSRSVKITYVIDLMNSYNKFLCPEHKGYARKLFEDWWKEHSDKEPPETIEAVIWCAKNGMLKPTRKIRLDYKPGNKFPEIKEVEIGNRFCLEEETNVQYNICEDCKYFFNNACGVSGKRVREYSTACGNFKEK